MTRAQIRLTVAKIGKRYRIQNEAARGAGTAASSGDKMKLETPQDVMEFFGG